MSQQDVHEIVCPLRDRELMTLRIARVGADKIILALRRKLIEADSTLPDEYDGIAWQPIEEEYK